MTRKGTDAMPDFDVTVTNRDTGKDQTVRVIGARDAEQARAQAATDVWLAGASSPANPATKPMAVIHTSGGGNQPGASLTESGAGRLLTPDEAHQWQRIIAAGVFRGMLWYMLAIVLLLAVLALSRAILAG